MGFKFRKRIKIAPGVYVNIGKTGINSATIGKRGASLNVGKKGVRTTVGLPGSGISYTSDNLISGNSRRKASSNDALVDDNSLGQSLVLTNKQYRTLSAEEKKNFKRAGGKVKLSIGEKAFIALVALFLLGWLANRHPAENQNHPTSHPTVQSHNN